MLVITTTLLKAKFLNSVYSIFIIMDVAIRRYVLLNAHIGDYT